MSSSHSHYPSSLTILALLLTGLPPPPPVLGGGRGVVRKTQRSPSTKQRYSGNWRGQISITRHMSSSHSHYPSSLTILALLLTGLPSPPPVLGGGQGVLI